MWPAHREVLLFAAGEYKRVAAIMPDEKARERLGWKAAQIRGYADALTTEEYYRRQFTKPDPAQEK